MPIFFLIHLFLRMRKSCKWTNFKRISDALWQTEMACAVTAIGFLSFSAREILSLFDHQIMVTIFYILCAIWQWISTELCLCENTLRRIQCSMCINIFWLKHWAVWVQLWPATYEENIIHLFCFLKFKLPFHCLYILLFLKNSYN